MVMKDWLLSALATAALLLSGFQAWMLKRLENQVVRQSFQLSNITSWTGRVESDLRATRIAMGLEQPSPIERQAEALRKLLPPEK